MNPHHPSAHDVILAALAIDAPPSLEMQASLIEAALVEHGHLPHPDQPATQDDVDRVARWLAERSMHPRYTMEDGWKRLLESAPDVHVAHAAATRIAAAGTSTEVDEARRFLLAWLVRQQ